MFNRVGAKASAQYAPAASWSAQDWPSSERTAREPSLGRSCQGHKKVKQMKQAGVSLVSRRLFQQRKQPSELQEIDVLWPLPLPDTLERPRAGRKEVVNERGFKSSP